MNTLSTTHQQAIRQTRLWVEQVVIGLNLCPFASKPVKENKVAYIAAGDASMEQHLQQLADCFKQLDSTFDIETSLLIFPDSYQSFDSYLELLHLANLLLDDLRYTGIYQLASFHPEYCFENSDEDDAANFSNRSPYAMLHIIRENSVEKAVANFEGIEQVPERNVRVLRELGYHKMEQTLQDILHADKVKQE